MNYKLKFKMYNGVLYDGAMDNPKIILEINVKEWSKRWRRLIFHKNGDKFTYEYPIQTDKYIELLINEKFMVTLNTCIKFNRTYVELELTPKLLLKLL
jgi:hypothetical protein